MIVGIGIDAVEIERFTDWHQYSDLQLSRIFSEEEIHYCRSIASKTAERFAVRFAAREAFFKALSSAVPDHKIPFLRICKAVSVSKSITGKPELHIAWTLINESIEPYQSLISCTHTRTNATVIIILEKKNRGN